MVRGASEVAPGETGWRVAGSSAWLHVFASSQATYYDIDPTRSREPAARLLGLDWKGTGWSVTRQSITQQDKHGPDDRENQK